MNLIFTAPCRARILHIISLVALIFPYVSPSTVNHLKRTTLNSELTLCTLEQSNALSEDQENDLDGRVESLSIWNNVAYTISSNRLWIEPLFPNRYNNLHIYSRKMLKKLNQTVLSTSRSIVYNPNDNIIYMLNDDHLMESDLCNETVIYRLDASDSQTIMTDLAINVEKNILYWIERTDDHYSIVEWNIAQHKKKTLYLGQSYSNALHYDPLTDSLYWLEDGNLFTLDLQRIFRFSLLSNGRISNYLFKSNHILIHNGTTLYFDDTKEKIFRTDLRNITDSTVELVYQASNDTQFISSFMIVNQANIDPYNQQILSCSKRSNILNELLDSIQSVQTLTLFITLTSIYLLLWIVLKSLKFLFRSIFQLKKYNN